MKNIWVYRVVRTIIGGAFVYAGILKLTDVGAFIDVIDAYGLLPWGTVPYVANALPVVEVISGFGLVFNVRGALTLITAQILLFIAVLSYGIAIGLDVDCGCFGPTDPKADAFSNMRDALYRDFAMLGGCLFGYWRHWATRRPGLSEDNSVR